VRKMTLRKSQSGFTLIELLMALVITSIIGVVLVTTLSQTVSITWAGNKHMLAVKQVENALFYINRDAQSAASVSTAGDWLRITRPDGSLIKYNLIDPGDGQPVFLRRSLDGAAVTVARYIDNTDGLTACSYQNGVLSVQITTSLPGLGAASETRQLVVYPRLNQGD